MEAIIIDNKKYTTAEHVIKSAPIWCKGVRNGRELLKKKDINNQYFIYAKLTNEGWVEKDGKSVKYDKVLLQNVYLDKTESYINEINNNNVADENGIEAAPDIIDLNDNEKFVDNEGYVLDIETRGVR